MFKLATIAATLLAGLIHARQCDIMCMGIYSVDPVTCTCVPIKYMECHPQYGDNCKQPQKDIDMGRDWRRNPYRDDDWFMA